MVIKINSAITHGIESQVVPIEIDFEDCNDFKLHVIGTSERSARITRKKIQVALRNNGIEMPCKRITINLGLDYSDAKLDISSFDLPLALGILIGIKHITINPHLLHDSIFVGELSLEGKINRVHGILSNVIEAKRVKKKKIFLPKDNSKEASLIPDIDIYGVVSLTQIIDHLNNETKIVPEKNAKLEELSRVYPVDFNEVKGQYQAKRALQVAAAGRHHILFMGPPGAGKTMLATRLPTIMPPMSYHETLESTRIHSLLNAGELVVQRPVRSPHHSVTTPALIGGGINATPGEISLAHNGILFLDEFTEFKAPQIEALRQPLEQHKVNIVRRTGSVTFPAFFLLVAAFNPCPCGYLGDPTRKCECGKYSINNYLSKISGPILDRIDLQISLQSVQYDSIKSSQAELSSAQLYEKVEKAIVIQRNRFKNENHWNANMPVKEIEKHCQLSGEAEELIKKAFDALKLSMRGYHKILKVGRTIADLEGSTNIEAIHIKEALTYRSLDQTLARIRV